MFGGQTFGATYFGAAFPWVGAAAPVVGTAMILEPTMLTAEHGAQPEPGYHLDHHVGDPLSAALFGLCGIGAAERVFSTAFATWRVLRQDDTDDEQPADPAT